MSHAAFQLISLRPVDRHDGLRSAAARRNGRVMAMSPRRIVQRADAETRADLVDALGCTYVVFTSPDAVRAAHRVQTFAPKQDHHFFGVGEGTRRALQRAGVADARAPTRMDSEGLMSLPEMVALRRGDRVGLVTAPGGRGEIAKQLQARGVQVIRADVYERQVVIISRAAWQRLQQTLGDAASLHVLALSSGEAFTEWLAQCPAELSKPLRMIDIVASSERLANLAREHGFDRIAIAESARPHDLIAAINLA